MPSPWNDLGGLTGGDPAAVTAGANALRDFAATVGEIERDLRSAVPSILFDGDVGIQLHAQLDREISALVSLQNAATADANAADQIAAKIQSNQDFQFLEITAAMLFIAAAPFTDGLSLLGLDAEAGLIGVGTGLSALVVVTAVSTYLVDGFVNNDWNPIDAMHNAFMSQSPLSGQWTLDLGKVVDMIGMTLIYGLASGVVGPAVDAVVPATDGIVNSAKVFATNAATSGLVGTIGIASQQNTMKPDDVPAQVIAETLLGGVLGVVFHEAQPLRPDEPMVAVSLEQTGAILIPEPAGTGGLDIPTGDLGRRPGGIVPDLPLADSAPKGFDMAGLVHLDVGTGPPAAFDSVGPPGPSIGGGEQVVSSPSLSQGPPTPGEASAILRGTNGFVELRPSETPLTDTASPNVGSGTQALLPGSMGPGSAILPGGVSAFPVDGPLPGSLAVSQPGAVGAPALDPVATVPATDLGSFASAHDLLANVSVVRDPLANVPAVRDPAVAPGELSPASRSASVFGIGRSTVEGSGLDLAPGEATPTVTPPAPGWELVRPVTIVPGPTTTVMEPAATVPGPVFVLPRPAPLEITKPVSDFRPPESAPGRFPVEGQPATEQPVAPPDRPSRPAPPPAQPDRPAPRTETQIPGPVTTVTVPDTSVSPPVTTITEPISIVPIPRSANPSVPFPNPGAPEPLRVGPMAPDPVPAPPDVVSTWLDSAPSRPDFVPTRSASIFPAPPSVPARPGVIPSPPAIPRWRSNPSSPPPEHSSVNEVPGPITLVPGPFGAPVRPPRADWSGPEPEPGPAVRPAPYSPAPGELHPVIGQYLRIPLQPPVLRVFDDPGPAGGPLGIGLPHRPTHPEESTAPRETPRLFGNRWEAFLRGSDLWVRDHRQGVEFLVAERMDENRVRQRKGAREQETFDVINLWLKETGRSDEIALPLPAELDLLSGMKQPEGFWFTASPVTGEIFDIRAVDVKHATDPKGKPTKAKTIGDEIRKKWRTGQAEIVMAVIGPGHDIRQILRSVYPSGKEGPITIFVDRDTKAVLADPITGQTTFTGLPDAGKVSSGMAGSAGAESVAPEPAPLPTPEPAVPPTSTPASSSPQAVPAAVGAQAHAAWRRVRLEPIGQAPTPGRKAQVPGALRRVRLEPIGQAPTPGRKAQVPGAMRKVRLEPVGQAPAPGPGAPVQSVAALPDPLALSPAKSPIGLVAHRIGDTAAGMAEMGKRQQRGFLDWKAPAGSDAHVGGQEVPGIGTMLADLGGPAWADDAVRTLFDSVSVGVTFRLKGFSGVKLDRKQGLSFTVKGLQFQVPVFYRPTLAGREGLGTIFESPDLIPTWDALIQAIAVALKVPVSPSRPPGHGGASSVRLRVGLRGQVGGAGGFLFSVEGDPVFTLPWLWRGRPSVTGLKTGVAPAGLITFQGGVTVTVGLYAHDVAGSELGIAIEPKETVNVLEGVRRFFTGGQAMEAAPPAQTTLLASFYYGLRDRATGEMKDLSGNVGEAFGIRFTLAQLLTLPSFLQSAADRVRVWVEAPPPVDPVGKLAHGLVVAVARHPKSALPAGATAPSALPAGGGTSVPGATGARPTTGGSPPGDADTVTPPGGGSPATDTDAPTQPGARGLGQYGGVISPEVNGAGGTVWTSTGVISQNDMASIVNSGMYGGEVNIITGVHGSPDGSTIADPRLYADDLARFGNLPGVTVYNFPDMSPAELTKLLRGPGTTIGAFCDSGACLAPFR